MERPPTIDPFRQHTTAAMAAAARREAAFGRCSDASDSARAGSRKMWNTQRGDVVVDGAVAVVAEASGMGGDHFVRGR